MTRELFREDSYLKTCPANITAITDAGIQTDQSIFYPLGGGQLGDTGWLVTPDGSRFDISNTQKDRDTGIQYHNIDAPHSLAVGDSIALELDWPRRYRLMRFHSALHMLCSLIDAPVTSAFFPTKSNT